MNIRNCCAAVAKCRRVVAQVPLRCGKSDTHGGLHGIEPSRDDIRLQGRAWRCGGRRRMLGFHVLGGFRNGTERYFGAIELEKPRGNTQARQRFRARLGGRSDYRDLWSRSGCERYGRFRCRHDGFYDPCAGLARRLGPWRLGPRRLGPWRLGLGRRKRVQRLAWRQVLVVVVVI